MTLILPPAPKPIGNFRNHALTGLLVFISGQGPREADGTLHSGKVGRDFTVDQAYGHARLAGLNILAVLQDAIVDLRRVAQVVKLLGFVNAVPDFTDHPEVIDGCSDLFSTVFGEAGAHARSAIGVASLPRNIPLEIEAIFQLHP